MRVAVGQMAFAYCDSVCKHREASGGAGERRK